MVRSLQLVYFKDMNILALCGSLRPQSSNALFLQAARLLLPAECRWNFFEIKELPYFDPPLQFSPDLPSSVAALRSMAAKADYIFIATPEYAHGIPGVLKNSLEWLVCEETLQKKIVLLIGSPSGGAFVKEYLTETLRTMDLLVAPERTLAVALTKDKINSEGQILDPLLREQLQKMLAAVLASTTKTL